MKEKTFITITRQYGSGGVSIAEGIAKATGLKCYNRNIVAAAAESLDTFDDVQSVIEKSYDTPNDFVASLSALVGQGVPRQNQMYVQQARIIRELAEGVEGAVFVGRCADYILRDVPNHFSFFIYADDDYRRKRAKEIYKDFSFQDVLDVDNKRKSYYAYYTGRKWGDPQNYDLMINTTNLTTEQAVKIILDYVELRQK
ncbi:MAG: cytidylate kinase-like family protein [Selenomonadaceae bacterium]|nr:cytidylate kinase-like family protein [Selenomonadaceae bacterium]MBQ3727557.1 cytidylate kinase-like family protein [Selenomonadaceae bacterium]